MFKIYLLFVFTTLSLSVFGQTSSTQNGAYTAVTSEQINALEEIKKLNLQLVKVYSEKKIDEAGEIGKDILEYAQKNAVESDVRVFPALRNVAEVYVAKGKYAEAVKILEPIAPVYEKLGQRNDGERAKTLSRLAYAYTGKKDYKNAEASYLKVIALDDALYGAKNRQSADAAILLAGVYQLMKNDEQSSAYFIKAIEINDAVLSDAEKIKRTDLESYKCFSYHSNYRKTGKISYQENEYVDFMRKRLVRFPEKRYQGIVNGKALNLVKPPYPQSARQKRAEGFAVVRVEIDEQGNVISAKAYCGFLDFVEEVEKAARASKFSPTTVSGVATKVTGDIVYNFEAR